MATAGAVNLQHNRREKLLKALDTQGTGCGKQWTQCTAGDACVRAADWDRMTYVPQMATIFPWEIHSPLK
jgi:hypothetical protein